MDLIHQSNTSTGYSNTKIHFVGIFINGSSTYQKTIIVSTLDSDGNRNTLSQALLNIDQSSNIRFEFTSQNTFLQYFISSEGNHFGDIICRDNSGYLTNSSGDLVAISDYYLTGRDITISGYLEYVQ